MRLLMNPNPKIVPIGADEIRQTVLFHMEAPFTISDVVNKIEKQYQQHVDAMAVSIYLDQISRAGVVEQHDRKYWINVPDFSR